MSNQQTIGDILARYKANPTSVTVDELKALTKLKALNASGKPVEAKDAWRWINREQAAECLGQTVMNVDKLLKEKKLERGTGAYRGKIDVLSLCAHLRSKIEKTEAQADAERIELHTRRQVAKYRRIKTEIAELRLEQESGNLVSLSRVNNTYDTAALLLRSCLDDFVARLPEKLAGMSVREIGNELQKETDSVLADYKSQLQKAAQA